RPRTGETPGRRRIMRRLGQRPAHVRRSAALINVDAASCRITSASEKLLFMPASIYESDRVLRRLTTGWRGLSGRRARTRPRSEIYARQAATQEPAPGGGTENGGSPATPLGAVPQTGPRLSIVEPTSTSFARMKKKMFPHMGRVPFTPPPPP